MSVLLTASLAPSSWSLYERSWRKMVDFLLLLGLPCCLPISVPLILLFVAYLHGRKFAPSSIVSILSAVSYFHKANGFQDPTGIFIVSKVLAETRNISAGADTRLPITSSILDKLISATVHVFTSPYKALIMRAMMILAFKAYLRVGEMVPRCKSSKKGCLQLGDVMIDSNIITVHFQSFKHSSKQGPQTLRVRGNCIEGSNMNPIHVLQEFLQVRGRIPSILFSFSVHREFDLALKSLLNFCGLDSTQFKGNNFRIGAASAAAIRGESDAQIRAAGRWSSDAFKRYIRLA